MKYQKTKINTKLDIIVKDKKRELVNLKKLLPLKELKRKIAIKEHKRHKIRNFGLALKNKNKMSLIAEIKKASPSLGDINTEVDIIKQAKNYEKYRANAISVLADSHFKGDINFLEKIRHATTLPILRKDFIFDPYQIYETKAMGASCTLLIVAILDKVLLS